MRRLLFTALSSVSKRCVASATDTVRPLYPTYYCQDPTSFRSARSRNLWFLRSFSAETSSKEAVSEEKVDKEKEAEEVLEAELSDLDDTAKDVSTSVDEQYRQILEEKDATLTKLSEQMEAERKKLLLALAEAENLRSRFARESAQIKKFAVQGFATSLFTSLDNLDRAVASVPGMLLEVKDPESLNQEEVLRALHSLLSGVQMTQTEFGNVLKSNGIEKYDPINETFDPNEHMALFEIDDPSKEPGTIAVVTLCGYRMHDRIIRPAEVGVVRQSSNTKVTESDEGTETGS